MLRTGRLHELKTRPTPKRERSPPRKGGWGVLRKNTLQAFYYEMFSGWLPGVFCALLYHFWAPLHPDSRVLRGQRECHRIVCSHSTKDRDNSMQMGLKKPPARKGIGLRTGRIADC